METSDYKIDIETVAFVVALKAHHTQIADMTAYLVRAIVQPFGQPTGDLLMNLVINQSQMPVVYSFGEGSETQRGKS